MINDPTKVLFSTRYNFQKIYMEGQVTVAIADSVPYLEYDLVTHGLGYVPTVRVFYVPVSGQLWPMSPLQYSKLDGGSGTALQIVGSPILTTNVLKINVSNSSGAPQNVTFYYRIYLDE